MRRAERDRLLFLAAACLAGLIAIIAIKATGHHSQGLKATASYPVPEKKLGPLPVRARPMQQTAAPRVVAPGPREPIQQAIEKTFIDPEALSSGAPAFPPPAPPFVDPVAD